MKQEKEKEKDPKKEPTYGNIEIQEERQALQVQRLEC